MNSKTSHKNSLSHPEIAIGEFVVILWVDAETTHGWKTMAEIHEDTDGNVMSGGFLIRRTAKTIILAADCATGEPRNFNRFLSIPRNLVRAMRPTRVGGKSLSHFQRLGFTLPKERPISKHKIKDKKT